MAVINIFLLKINIIAVLSAEMIQNKNLSQKNDSGTLEIVIAPQWRMNE